MTALGAGSPGDLPWSDDTTDLRVGAPLHERQLALLPLVGRWRGGGTGVSPAGVSFRFEQSMSFAHDGRPFLVYQSAARLIGADGGVLRSAVRESGFWRPGGGADDIEVAMVTNTGLALTYAGSAQSGSAPAGGAGSLRWELRSTSAAATPTAIAIHAERRLYALVPVQDEAAEAGRHELVYVTELVTELVNDLVTEQVSELAVKPVIESAPAPGQPLWAPHLNARLVRVG